MNIFTFDDIENAIYKLDTLKRPYIIFLNPIRTG